MGDRAGVGEQNWLVVSNPASGSHSEELARLIAERLREAGRVTLRVTSREDAGEGMTREGLVQGITHVLACGGDGTVMSVANGIARSRHPATLAILPAGTANLVAAALGIPIDPESALETALNGGERVIDLGYLDGHYFALGVGIGAAERFVTEVESEQKQRVGPLAYLRSLSAQAGSPATSLKLRVDGGKRQTLFASAAMVVNAGHVGKSIKPMSEIKMDDGMLDLVILQSLSRWDLLRLAVLGLFGVAASDRSVISFQGKQFELEAIPHGCVQIDGDEVDCEMPLRIETKPAALRVRVPAETSG